MLHNLFSQAWVRPMARCSATGATKRLSRRRRSSAQQLVMMIQQQRQRTLFTNTDAMKRRDPYALLGLSWGDGATVSEIKAAYRQKALELHPDVVATKQGKNNKSAVEAAQREFANVQWAYETLVEARSSHNNDAGSEQDDEAWRVSVWRNGDRLAQHRTDVAGVARKRPQPAVTLQKSKNGSNSLFGALLGHPDGRGASSSVTRGEYLGDGRPVTTTSSSVGRGLNKWVKKKEFTPWDGATKATRASDMAKRGVSPNKGDN